MELMYEPGLRKKGCTVDNFERAKPIGLIHHLPIFDKEEMHTPNIKTILTLERIIEILNSANTPKKPSIGGY